jgi:transposase
VVDGTECLESATRRCFEQEPGKNLADKQFLNTADRLAVQASPQISPKAPRAADSQNGVPSNYFPIDSKHVLNKWTLRVQGLRAKLKVQVVKRSDTGFKVLPRRWVVERTFAWFMRQRRLVRDYETTETSAEAWLYIAMIRIQLRRLA